MSRPGPDDFEMRAALYVAGAMTPEERSQWEELLAQQHAEALFATRAASLLADALASLTPPVTPSPQVKQELFARVAGESIRNDQHVKRAAGTNWKPTGFAGIAIRRLSMDRNLRREMFLLKMEPGSTLPDHRHSQAEECYVVEGSLRTRGVLLHAGDFIKLDAGSQHGVTTTEEGCVVLIAAGLAEEVGT